MVDHVDHDPGVVSGLVADSRYDDGVSLEQLQQHHVTTCVPRASRVRPDQISKDEFVYEPEHDRYRCPNGCYLNYFNSEPKARRRRYAAAQSDCAECPLKDRCTKGSRRYVNRHVAEAAREQTVRSGPRYRQLMHHRRVAEHLLLLAKRDHGMRRARGLAAACIQVALTAAAINLKKLVRFTAGPAGAAGATAAAVLCALWRRWRHLRLSIALPAPPPAAYRFARSTRLMARS